MDADILRSLLNCNLREEETLPIQIQGFSMAMSKAWNCKDVRVARVLGPILQVFFPSLEEKELICGTGPWFFDSHLLVINDWR
ncbi:hypothetical protein LIER_43619 [Lithospermum erythrorhizon]|uniref:DUF4283 domain-containing protein n=1 Tax=Lithospermum erythrorhizon TaxID=34254 RepID=A0AAV3QIU1_LITER